RLGPAVPDLALGGVTRPEGAGYHVGEHVRRPPRLGAVPVLLISGIADGSVLQRAAEVGASDVMFKPFSAEDLVRKTEDLLLGPAVSTTVEADPMTSPAPHGPDRPEPMPDWAPPAPDLKNSLEQFVALGGVRSVVVADRGGSLVEAAGDLDLPADVTAALASCLVDSSEGLGSDLGRGALTGMMLEYESGTVLLYGIGSSALLAVVVDD